MGSRKSVIQNMLLSAMAYMALRESGVADKVKKQMAMDADGKNVQLSCPDMLKRLMLDVGGVHFI